MFWATYKNTTKNILRNVSFWLFLRIYVALLINKHTAVYEWYKFDPITMEQMFYTDPDYIFDYQSYVKEFCDTFFIFLCYMVPLFAVVTTALTVSSDYGNMFFEVEKAGNIKTYKYVFARIAALTVLNSIVAILFAAAWYHLTFTTKGVIGMTTAEIIIDSIYRLLLNGVCRAVPCVLFHVCLTYAIGTFVKHGVATGIIGMAYALANYIYDSRFDVADTSFYVQYLIPVDPRKVMNYLYYFDSEWFEWMIETFKTSLGKAAIALGIMVGSAALFAIISYLRTRTRVL